MDKVSRLYYNRCQKWGLDPLIIKDIYGFKIQLGHTVYFFRSGIPPFNDASSLSIAHNKYSTNALLHKAHLPVPKAIAISRKEYRDKKFNLDNLQFPLVIKPTWDSACGHGVICNIQNKEQLFELLELSYKKYKCMSVEEFHKNLRSYRVLVFYNRVIGVVERVPAKVTGDNLHTIHELIDIENEKRLKNKKTLPLGPLKLHLESDMIFEERGINVGYKPEQNEIIPLRYICNATFGGTVIGLNTNVIHPDNAKAFSHAAKVLNLNIVGFDVICDDIGIPFSFSKAYIIEANPSPDISIHENAIQGVATPVTIPIIKQLIRTHWFAYFFTKVLPRYLSLITMTFVLILFMLLCYKLSMS